MRLAGQAIIYAAFFAVVGALSFSPTYTRLDPELALLKLSFSHGGARKGGCRRFTPEELAELAPNMRRPLDCPRERVPVLVELRVDGELLYREAAAPSGLAGDGPSTVYERFPLAPGEHRLEARLRDSERDAGFDWEADTVIDLAPREVLAIDFRPEDGGFRVLGR